VTTCAQRNGPSASRLVAGSSPHMRDRVHLDWNGTFLKLPETDVNLIVLDRGCLDKDTNSALLRRGAMMRQPATRSNG
jgi:hypothetical protein